MSFSFLPWLLYVLIAISSAVTVFIFIKKASRNFPKSFLLGLSLASVGAIITGINKFTSNMQILTQYQEHLIILTMTCTSSGIVLIMIGAYNKVKNYSEKRNIMLNLFGVLIITVIFMGLIVLSILK